MNEKLHHDRVFCRHTGEKTRCLFKMLLKIYTSFIQLLAQKLIFLVA